MIGKLWFGSWKDYKKIGELYDTILISVCRYPPYRYYGSVQNTGVLDFRHLGPSPELHEWRRTEMDSKKDQIQIWTVYYRRYEDELGNRECGSKSDQEYNAILDYLEDGKDVCILCTCLPEQHCHRFLLWQNIIFKNKLPIRGSAIKIDWPFPISKVTDETWEKNGIRLFEAGKYYEYNPYRYAFAHPEMSAAYDRLIRKGVLVKTNGGLYLKGTALESIQNSDR